MLNSLPKIYEQTLQEASLQSDDAQKFVISRLAALSEQIVTAKPQSKISAIFSRKKPVTSNQGIYIWGEVGRGKSMLMQMFYDNLPIADKLRIHFHNFMLNIHKEVHLLRQKNDKNPLASVAKNIAAKYRVICLDEFQVTDIADAMILARLFKIFFAAGVVFVITSNRPPGELYLGGLQREKFLDFVDLLAKHSEILELASPQDYRMRQLAKLKSSYLYPLSPQNRAIFDAMFKEATNGEITPLILHVQGRQLHVANACRDIAMFSFADLCEKPLAAADYIAIAENFNSVFLSDIPELSPEKRNEARRFVTLIDALYDAKIKLICTAAVACEQIYASGDGNFEFARTVSRLHEMQSEQYISSSSY